MSKARGRRRMAPATSGPDQVDQGGSSSGEVGTNSVQWSAWLLTVLAVIGIGLAGYLTSVHYAHTPLVCSDQGVVDCQKVLSSIYSVIPGTSVPITVPGTGFFLISLVLALAQLRRPANYRLRQAHAAWGGLGVLTAFYLVFAELVELRTICLWCTSVHIALLLTFLVALWRLYPKPRSA
ncbi:MAG: vitamin K epoxide reductase family protein [Candidatus Dormiibacterota bacterium]